MEALRTWRDYFGLTLKGVRRRVPPTYKGLMISRNQWGRAEQRGVFPKPQALQRYCQGLGIDLYHLFGVQAIIEQRIYFDPLYEVETDHEDLIQEFWRRSKLRKRDAVPREPGKLLFDPKGEPLART